MSMLRCVKTVPLVIAVMLLVPCSAQSSSSVASKSTPCAEPQQTQFDFWIGEWNLTWPGQNTGETTRGTNSIKRILGSCVVEENFDGGTSMHLRGMSVSTFDSRAGKWKQTWVDNEGAYLDFVGEFRDGQMTLQREATKPDGARVLQRMVYKNITRNEFDWTWERSQDGGKTWEVLWPIHYKRKS